MNANRTSVDFAYLKSNMVGKQLDIYFTHESSKSVHIKILSFDGKVLQKANLQTAPGFSNHQMPVNNLPRGFYLVNVSNGTDYSNFKIFKE